jgi:hypothetical protein
MTLKVLVALGLAAALSCAPREAVAHKGHDHGTKAKTVKKSKPKKAAIEFAVRRGTV